MSEFFESLLDPLISRPFLMLLMVAAPLYLMAKWGKTYPTHRLLLLVGLPFLISLMLLIVPAALYAVSKELARSVSLILNPIIINSLVVIDLLVVLVLVADWICFRWVERPWQVQRQIKHVVSLGKKAQGEIELVNPSRWGFRLQVQDDFPDTFQVDPPEFSCRIAARSRLRLKYQVTPLERGRCELQGIHLKISSPWGFWKSLRLVPLPDHINVYPDLQQITEFDLLAKRNRLSQMGLRRTRKIGQDNEFERLRDYTQDDNYKHIDWRSSARRQKLTVRDFQSNQSQQVIFMIDCGRMMTSSDRQFQLLDYSLNAMLMLAYVALRQGDSVGMISFSNRIHNYTPLRTGIGHINRLLHASFNQRANYVESRYDEAFYYLRANCRKRSLVVLITNVIDEINAHQIQQYLNILSGTHLPLAVLLRDREVFSAIDEVDYDRVDSIYQASAAVDILGWRQKVISDLKHRGVLTLDVFPDQLTTAIVNQYLEVKARHLL